MQLQELLKVIWIKLQWVQSSGHVSHFSEVFKDNQPNVPSKFK